MAERDNCSQTKTDTKPRVLLADLNAGDWGTRNRGAGGIREVASDSAFPWNKPAALAAARGRRRSSAFRGSGGRENAPSDSGPRLPARERELEAPFHTAS
ncbi:hypothetical protein AAFF_G00058760 [Aldrovandia affinis]|uniref:Uncharacterized protein n=1 Tax=Aldrovandia affinis TaxID=143900 RepID=A0AAD7WE37_9TELE|nr:hypothetical protein AAFF_G00058760 [Aldrovandia affinis]